MEDLLDYCHHYNQQMAEVMQLYEDRVSERSRLLFSHVLNAHQVWNTRMAGEGQPFGVWELHELADFTRIDQANVEQSRALLARLPLDQRIGYHNSRGEPYSNSVGEILFHIVNHSTHHRGQIVSDMKLSGIPPLVMDYIFFKR